MSLEPAQADVFIGDGESGARFSPCRNYRYTLWRRWQPDCPIESMVAFIGLNPSTADETEDDPTIRRCIGFTKSWGFDGFVMLNLFGFRATNPKVMFVQTDPIGTDNNTAIQHVAARVGGVVCAWGTHGVHRLRGFHVHSMLSQMSLENVWHLGLTDGGFPKHPLYLKSTTERVRW